MCKKLGHTIKPVLPSLVQFVGSDSFYKEWAGVRSNEKASLYVDNQLVKEDSGEVMLTDYGISDICVYNLSGNANRALNLVANEDKVLERIKSQDIFKVSEDYYRHPESGDMVLKYPL